MKLEHYKGFTRCILPNIRLKPRATYLSSMDEQGVVVRFPVQPRRDQSCNGIFYDDFSSSQNNFGLSVWLKRR